MAVGELDHRAVTRLTRRLLPSQLGDDPAGPQPVVVLLGPVGAGKTRALRAVAAGCGGGVVHAHFDFASAPESSTPEVLARLAFDFARKWPARRGARFTRLTLGLIAVQAPLRGRSREEDRARLAALIGEFARSQRADRLARAVGEMFERAAEMRVPAVPYQDLLREVLPVLIRSTGRKPVGAAKRWHADFPEADGAEPLDALLALNRVARTRPTEVTGWLAEAFLADIRDSHQRMSAPDPGSPCRCLDTGGRRHRHSWVLLLDNIDHAAGTAFVGDLLAARERYQRLRPGEHDPLLVIASSGRWQAAWESSWAAPWKAWPAGGDRARPVLPANEAGYEFWAGAQPRPLSWYLPVLLEPLEPAETAAILRTDRDSPLCQFVQRATAGLPGAVHYLAAVLRDRELPEPGARDVLAPHGQSYPPGLCWEDALREARLTDHVKGLGLAEFVAAAPFATAPWLVPHDAASLISRSSVGRILTELRTALWVRGPGRGATVSDQCVLHPWIGRTLTSALVRGPAGERSYAEQFRALLADSLGDPVREAYCRLALGEVGRVVSTFTESFADTPHQEWVERLRLVASAPDALPIDRTGAQLYGELVGHTRGELPPDGLARTIARLLVASWLAADPLAMPDPALLQIVENSYRDLAPLSPRSDVAALHLAAEQLREPGR